MDILGIGPFNLRGLERKNLLLGKNGCGKSYLLRLVEQQIRSKEGFGSVKYISPERGGILQYEPSFEQNITANVNWLSDSRRQNQAGQFRQQSAAQFRRLEVLLLREIEKNSGMRADMNITFDSTVSRLNTLLDRVQIQRADPAFRIIDRLTGTQVQPQEISSGESELISLGIECLMFERDCSTTGVNLLLMDEPDVHLHPDLQARLAHFINDLIGADRFRVLIATHSTTLLGAMSDDQTTRVAFMRHGNTDISFGPVTESLQKVIPVFGAHPLSNVFNRAPILLLEGEDDERIWQQAVRSSEGRIHLYPCSVDGSGNLPQFEEEVVRILEAVYDDAVGYSLRDRDEGPTEIADLGPLRRMRLFCRTAENLLLTDEVLRSLGVVWGDLQRRITDWLARNTSHPHYAQMKAFADSGFDRSSADLKQVRNDLTGLLGTNKPWEVIVGQTIASLPPLPAAPSPTSFYAFMGPRLSQELQHLRRDLIIHQSSESRSTQDGVPPASVDQNHST